jgi:hypothetical protein
MNFIRITTIQIQKEHVYWAPWKGQLLTLAKQQDGLPSLSVINLILIETHKSTYDECLHGLVFNAFECIHSGYGTKGDFSAILSNWKSF